MTVAMIQSPWMTLWRHSSHLKPSYSSEQYVYSQLALRYIRLTQILCTSPFDSCLSPGSASYSHLPTILDLLEFSHKYCARSIEKKALDRARQLSTSDTISKQPRVILPRILELSATVGSVKLGKAARTRIVDEIWTKPKVAKIALEFGERLGDLEITGGAYYSLMVQGITAWRSDETLSDSQKDRLTLGAFKAADNWTSLQHSWFAKAPCCQQRGCPVLQGAFMASLGYQASVAPISAFDHIRRIESISQGLQIYGHTHTQTSSCEGRLRLELSAARDLARVEVANLFTLPTSSS